MEDCIFCKIIKNEIDADFLYEDEKCVAFRDINPKSATHILIVPKKHIPSIIDMADEDSDLIGELVKTARNIAADLGLRGYKLQFNVGKDGGQEIFHIHLHLMSKFN